MLCNYGLHNVEKSVVLEERVRCWGKLGGGADHKFDSGRVVGEKREDMASDCSIIWKDILVKLSVEDAASITRRTM